MMIVTFAIVNASPIIKSNQLEFLIAVLAVVIVFSSITIQSNKIDSCLDWLAGSSDLFLGTKKEIGDWFKFKISDKKLTALYKNGRLYDFLKGAVETEKGNIYE